MFDPQATACENAQLALAANPTCASAQASSEVAFDSGSPIAESDVITVCTQTCRNLISDSVVMCTKNIVSYSTICIMCIDICDLCSHVIHNGAACI